MKLLLRVLLIALPALFPPSVSAQSSQSAGENTNVPVRDARGSYYLFPWAGGMNSCQFGTVDLDLDGIKDLVAFDRTGNRILTFLNHGTPGKVDYEFAPEFADKFPAIYDWMILADYNKDGREDIFTYSPGVAGMKVFKNVSETQLQFDLIIYPYLTSFQGAIYTNILVTYADYPGIADIDGDGDLDILTFWGLGSFVEMHRNLSFEKYGHYDSLDYEKTTLCWGSFAESEESNELSLDTCVGWVRGPSVMDEALLPHTGSTFLVIDLDGDQVQDVLLGDVDYPNLIALNNTGTKDSAYIGSFDQSFPSYDRSIKLYSMPVAASIDVDNDGIKDLLVTPFDPNPVIGENKNSNWLYLNSGTSQVPEYHFHSADFLQEQMIDAGDGSYPVLADYNGDGLKDLFIGNYGYYDSSYMDQYLILHTVHTGKIALYQNIGTAGQPEFTFITDDFSNVSALEKKGVMPAFGDLDSDGDLDMLTGYEDGKVCLYENVAGLGQPMDLKLVEMNYEGIDVGDFSTVQLFDLDGDAVLDLVIGERGGNINYYKGSQGSSWMEFSLLTDSLGKINVTDPDLSIYGFSVPFFFKDDEGNTLLIVGSEQGKLFFFNSIDGNLQGEFAVSDTLGTMIGFPNLKNDFGYRTAACIADMNQDGLKDMFAGNFSGGLEFFSVLDHPAVSGAGELMSLEPLVRVFPNPSSGNVTVRVLSGQGVSILSVDVQSAMGSAMVKSVGLREQEAAIDLNGLAPGVYFIRITLAGIHGDLNKIYKKIVLF